LLLLLLLLCLGGLSYYLWGRDTGNGGATPTSTSSTGGGTAVPPVTTPPVTTPPATTEPSPTATAEPTPTATAPATIAVPDLVGKTAAEAEKILKDAGFTKEPSFVSGDNPDDAVQILGDWVVTAQDPEPGKQVGADTEIILTVKHRGGNG
jgi:hypothetical protein